MSFDYQPFLNVPYKYVEDMADRFCQELANNQAPRQPMGLELMLTAHGDKARQYRELGEEHNVPYGKLLLVYLLSYESPWTQEVRYGEKSMSIQDWLVQSLTQDGPIKRALDALPVHRVAKDVDDGEIELYVDGHLEYSCRRDAKWLWSGVDRQNTKQHHEFISRVFETFDSPVNLNEHTEKLVDAFLEKTRGVHSCDTPNFGEWVLKTYYPEVLQTALVYSDTGIKAVLHSDSINYVGDWLKILFRRRTLQIKSI